MTALRSGRLRADVVAEPLINQWYAWSYLIPPACAARYLTHAQLPVMDSFVEAPQVHADALRNPELAGGPFIQYPAGRVAEIRELAAATRREQWALLALSEAITALDALLAAHPAGAPFDTLYAQVPAALRGYVELVYDGRDGASARYIEGLLYRSAYYREENQSLALRRLPDCDRRAFVMSTPRLVADLDHHLVLPFADPRVDSLFRLRDAPGDVAELAARLDIPAAAQAGFFKLFEARDLAPPRAPEADCLRVRYLGHACVLLETREVSVLCDPLIAYANPQGLPRYSHADLPARIDYALITHNHQDHVMLETLLQLRHKIGQVIVPRGQKGSLLDPSLAQALRRIGFPRVVEIDELEQLPIPGGEITSVPVLGEHGDLNIATKTAYWLRLLGRSVLCAADSNNLDTTLYAHLSHQFGVPDVLFIGMECEGAPYTWTYGPLLPRAVPHAQAQRRRLDGSNAARAIPLVDTLQPAQVYVYAMGQEPWLEYITSIHYTDESPAIVESNALVAHCRARGLDSERLFGRKEILLRARQATRSRVPPLPVAAVPAGRGETPPPAVRPAPAAASAAPRTQPDAAQAQALTALFKTLRELDVRLWLEEGQLRCTAPKGALSAELTAQLKEAKPAIVALLQGQSAPTPAARATDSAADEDALALRDTALPEALVPAAGAALGTDQAKRILLTGASGFFGAYLLEQLLLQTRAEIHCLVRAEDAAAAQSRLEARLRACGVWREDHAGRVIAVAGDLARERLGLSATDHARLAAEIDVVHHNGAWVHHALPYAQLRACNVLGTREIIAFACHTRPKALHYVSSLSVLPPAPPPGRARMLETDDLGDYPLPPGGYNRSKWVAERLLAAARQRGLPVAIYRPGPISGDSRSGAFNADDFLCRLMLGYVQSGLAPEGEMPLDLLPVDYASRALIWLSRQPAALGRVFHLLHAAPVSSNLLFTACRQAGYAIERVPYAEWYRHLTRIAHGDPAHALYPLVALFSSRQGRVVESTVAPPPFDASAAESLLRDAPFAPPALDVALFSTYLEAMIRSGALPPAPPSRARAGAPA